jgi:hypothetical protein
MKVRIPLLGAQIAVLLGNALAMDCAVFDRPTFISDLHPAGQIAAVEKAFPASERVARWRCGGDEDNRYPTEKHRNQYSIQAFLLQLDVPSDYLGRGGNETGII